MDKYEELAKECSNFINEETIPPIWNKTHLISVRLVLSRAFRWRDEQLKQRLIEEEVCPLCNQRFEKSPEADFNER